jgi:glycosyltransferase involved in cell wall biosynthesis
LKDEKHILLITYYWPPSGGAGVQRWLKMLNYLAEENVVCTVITVDPKVASYPILDDSLLQDVSPKIRVFHTHTHEPLNAYKKFTGSKETPYSGFANESSPSITKRFSRWIRANFFIPDARKGWNKFAYRKAMELLRTEHFDAVITTSPPHSTQLIGLKLKEKFPIKWIADLRDPWTDIYYAHFFPQTKWAKKKDLRLERRVLEGADELIVVSQAIKVLFQQKGNVSSVKVHVIPNGFDEKDFTSFSHKNSKSLHEKLQISYTGALSDQYPLDSLCKALDEVVGKVDLNFVGKVYEKAMNALSKYGAQFKGFVEHHESISELKNADILLLIIPDIENNEGILTGKLFEYLGSTKSILFIGPSNGDAAKIIRECNAGVIFDYDDHLGMLNFLNEALSKKQNNLPLSQPNKEAIKNYSRKKLASKVKALIN